MLFEVRMLEHYGDPESWKQLFNVEDVNLKVHEHGFYHCSMLDIKDDISRASLLHYGSCKLITPGCGVDQQLAAISANLCQHRLPLICAVGCTESLIWPFTPNRASRRISRLKRKLGSCI